MIKLNRNLKLLLLMTTLISLGNGLVLPLFPLFLNGLKADTIQIGLIISLGSVAATVVVLPAGLLADRFRRRNLLILGSAISAVSFVSLTTVDRWEQSIMGYLMLNGAFAVMYPPSITMAADNSENGNATIVYGLLNSTWLVGMIIGPFVGGLLADALGWNSIFNLAILISAVSIFPSLSFMRTKGSSKKQNLSNTNVKFLRKEILLPLAIFSLSQCLLSVAVSNFNLVLPLYLTNSFSQNQAFVGIFLSAGQMATLVSQVSSGMLAREYNSRRILILSMFPLPLLSLLWLWMRNLPELIILNILIFGLWGMTWPVAQEYLMNLSPNLMRGRTISISETLVRVGFALGPVLGGYLWGFFGISYSFCASATFFASAFLLVLLLKKTRSVH